MHTQLRHTALAFLALAATLVLASCSGLLGITPLQEGSPADDMTSFAFLKASNPGLAADVTATISHGSITATVPFGTDVHALVATFSTTGETVAVDDVAQTSGVTAVDFTDPVTYVVTAASGATQEFTVSVTVAESSSKDLTAFSFLAANNPVLGSDVTATITGTEIAATVPFGTDVTALTATFSATSANVRVAGVMQTSGSTANDFSSPLVYRVTAADLSTQDYTVTVTVALNPSKDLTSFAFLAANNPALAGDVTATINGTSVTAVVPFGTDVTALKSSFTTTGVKVSVGGTTQTSGATPNNFTSAVIYRVTAEDGTTQDYTVNVSISLNPSKELTAFSFLAANNPGLGADVTAGIAGTSITATVPFGTDVTALVPSFSTTGAKVTVGGTIQTSGVTPQNFTSPVVYRVTAADTTTKDFTVTVTIALNPAKDITAYSFLASKNPGLSSNVTGSISGTSITVVVPLGTVVTNLKATFTTTGASVKVGAVTQVSGTTANNFTNPVVYRVTAADGTTKDFTVTVVAKDVDYATQTTIATGDEPAAVAAGDLNGDGRPDLAVVDQGASTVSIYLNQTAPGATTATFGTKFDFATPSDCRQAALGDLNGDGRPDVAVACGSGKVAVFLNTTPPGTTTPTFATRTDFTTPQTVYVAIADLNGDGQLDLATANINTANVSVLLNTTTPGSFTPAFATHVEFAAGTNPESIAAGDLDGDGVADLVTANLNSNDVTVLLNTTAPGAATPAFAAKASFTTSSGPFTGPISVAIGDLNGDGKPDLGVANNGAASVSVLLNTTVPGSAATFATHADFTVGGFPTAVALADTNDDGVRDVVVTVNGTSVVSVLLDTTAPGASTVALAPPASFAVGSGVQSVAAAELNGDGRLDLVTANFNDDTLSVLLNTSTVGRALQFNGTADSNTGNNPVDPLVVDLNGDGRPDVVAPNAVSNNITVYTNTTAPGAVFGSLSNRLDLATGTSPRAIAAADLNGDGLPDLVVVNTTTNNMSVFFNTTTPGSATLAFSAKVDFATGVAPLFVVTGDIDGDGRPDVVVANDNSDSASVFLNRTTPGGTAPTFATRADFSTGSHPVGIVLGDLDGNGSLDIVTANDGAGSVSVLLGTTPPGAASASFAPHVDFLAGAGTFSVTLGDFDGDGRLDVAAANETAGTVSVLLNRTAPGASTPTLATKVDSSVGTSPRFAAVGDLDGDGRPDLAVANLGSTFVSVLRNTTAPGAATASFGTAISITSQTSGGLQLADLNGDGKLDLVVTDASLDAISLFMAK